jgi:hypothetical protein
MAVQVWQARSWAVAQETLSNVPASQAPRQATQALPLRVNPLAQAVHSWSLAFVQVSAAQFVMAVQLVQARSCSVVHEVLSCCPLWQAAQVAQATPSQKRPASQATQIWLPAVVQVVAAQLPTAAQVEQTRLCAVAQDVLS